MSAIPLRLANSIWNPQCLARCVPHQQNSTNIYWMNEWVDGWKKVSEYFIYWLSHFFSFQIRYRLTVPTANSLGIYWKSCSLPLIHPSQELFSSVQFFHLVSHSTNVYWVPAAGQQLQYLSNPSAPLLSVCHSLTISSLRYCSSILNLPCILSLTVTAPHPIYSTHGCPSNLPEIYAIPLLKILKAKLLSPAYKAPPFFLGSSPWHQLYTLLT